MASDWRSVDQRLGGGGCNQGIRQDEFRAADVGMANCDFRIVLEANPSGIVVGTEHDAGKALAAILGKKGFDTGEMPGEAVPVLDPGQRPGDSSGTNFPGP